MKIFTLIRNTALIGLTAGLSFTALATEPTTTADNNTVQQKPQEISGGLDRDIIRRVGRDHGLHAQGDEKIKGMGIEHRQMMSGAATSRQINRQPRAGVEPDEIDHK